MITILTSKMAEMEKLVKTGMEEVKGIVEKVYSSTVKGIAGSIVAEGKKKNGGGSMGALDGGA
jgi:hypothetical protein